MSIQKPEQFLAHFPDCPLQTFDDVEHNGKKRGSKNLARIFSKYQQHFLSNYQAHGAGVYFAINPTTNLEKRDIAHLKHISAVGLDLDIGKEKEKLSFAELQERREKQLTTFVERNQKHDPHFIIQTKNGIQPVWLFEPFTDYSLSQEANELYRKVVQGICEYLGMKSEGDNVVRVLRLPLPTHYKTLHEPFSIQLVHSDLEHPRYNFQEFLKVYCPEPPKKSCVPKCETHVQKRAPQKKRISGNDLLNQIFALPLEQVLQDAGRESGISITFRKNSNGTQQIVENNETTSGFLSQDGQFCYSMSGKERKGNQIHVVMYYRNCRKGEAIRWLKEKYQLRENNTKKKKSAQKKGAKKSSEKPIASNVAHEVLKKESIAQFSKKFFMYREGIWEQTKKEEIHNLIIGALENTDWKHTRHLINDIREYVEDYAYMQHGKQLEETILASYHKNHEAVFVNGIVDTDTWKMQPFRKEQYLITKLPFPYEERKYACPLWQGFLEQIFEPDEDCRDRIDFMQEWFGYSLVPDTSQEKALILVGEGSNGKSVLLEIWQELLGDENYSAIDLPDINREQYTAKLLGKLLNICSDIRSEAQLDTGIFKKLVSGERLMGKEIYQEPITFTNYARIIFATNALPYLREGGTSVRRRLHIVHFQRQFTEENKDRNLKTKLLKELPEIFLWAVDGLKRLKKRGQFLPPASVEKAVDDYLHQYDSVVSYVEEMGEVTGKAEHSYDRRMVYQDYRNYCENSGIHALSNRRFFPKIEALGVLQRASNGRRLLVGLHLPHLDT